MIIDLSIAIIALLGVIIILVLSLLLWLRATNKLPSDLNSEPKETGRHADIDLYRMLIIDAQSVIHDGKNLIVHIKLPTEEIQERLAGKRGSWSNKLKAEVQRELDGIRHNADKLKNMMDGLLVNFERNELSLQLEKVNILTLCEEVKDSLQTEAAQTPVRLITLQPRLKPLSKQDLEIQLDRVLIKRVLRELIYNGIKYSTGEDPQVAIDIGRDDDYLIVQILDNGKGIPDEESSKIFEPGFRGRHASAIDGKGIGLFTVRAIAREHQGQLDVDNHPKETQPGSSTKWITKFTLKLPHQQYKR